MTFNVIRKNKIIAKISESRVAVIRIAQILMHLQMQRDV